VLGIAASYRLRWDQASLRSELLLEFVGRGMLVLFIGVGGGGGCGRLVDCLSGLVGDWRDDWLVGA